MTSQSGSGAEQQSADCIKGNLKGSNEDVGSS